MCITSFLFISFVLFGDLKRCLCFGQYICVSWDGFFLEVAIGVVDGGSLGLLLIRVKLD